MRCLQTSLTHALPKMLKSGLYLDEDIPRALTLDHKSWKQNNMSFISKDLKLYIDLQRTSAQFVFFFQNEILHVGKHMRTHSIQKHTRRRCERPTEYPGFGKFGCIKVTTNMYTYIHTYTLIETIDGDKFIYTSADKCMHIQMYTCIDGDEDTCFHTWKPRQNISHAQGVHSTRNTQHSTCIHYNKRPCYP
jgi:hypothetical protein